MANLKYHWPIILLTLLFMLVVAGLIGHFVLDISGREPLTAFGLHAGFILLPLLAVNGMLMLVTTLLDDDPIRHWQSLRLLIHPPVMLR